MEGGTVVESDFDEGDGLIIERYNTHHYVVSETLDADGRVPIVFAYNLDRSAIGQSGRRCLAWVRPVR